MSKPLIILWIRRNKEYYLDNEIRGYSWPFTGTRKSTKRLEAIQKWNKFFKISYTEFRKELKNIAQKTYQSLPVDRIYLWEDLEELNLLPENSWIFPVDEDDWIDPITFSYIVNKINDYKNKKVIYCNAFFKTTCGKITYGRNLFSKPGLPFGYFVKTPCSYRSIGSFGMEKGIGKTNLVQYVDRSIGVKLDNPTSLSVLQVCNILKISRYMRIELQYRFPIPGYKESLEKYWNLLKKTIV